MHLTQNLVVDNMLAIIQLNQGLDIVFLTNRRGEKVHKFHLELGAFKDCRSFKKVGRHF